MKQLVISMSETFREGGHVKQEDAYVRPLLGVTTPGYDNNLDPLV